MPCQKTPFHQIPLAPIASGHDWQVMGISVNSPSVSWRGRLQSSPCISTLVEQRYSRIDPLSRFGRPDFRVEDSLVDEGEGTTAKRTLGGGRNDEILVERVLTKRVRFCKSVCMIGCLKSRDLWGKGDCDAFKGGLFSDDGLSILCCVDEWEVVFSRPLTPFDANEFKPLLQFRRELVRR
jgi:hypothetical protein